MTILHPHNELLSMIAYVIPETGFRKRVRFTYYFNSDPHLTGEAVQNSQRQLALVSPNWPHGIGLDKMVLCYWYVPRVLDNVAGFGIPYNLPG